MKLSDYLANEELNRLTDAWRRLTWWQKKAILLRAFPHLVLPALNAHIERRLSRFVYLFPAHWVT